MISIRKTLLATSCVLALAGSASATVITEAFDGSWTDPTAIGTNKGLLIDVIPEASTVFGAFFSYANDGSQIWTTVQFEYVQGQNDYTNVPVTRFTGGQFSAAGTPTPVALGTASISLSCTGITMNITPAAGSNLAEANFAFEPSANLKKLTTGQCNEPVAACPEGTSADGTACQLPNTIANNLFLPAGKVYTIRGKVVVQEGAALTIAPGVTVRGSSNRDQTNFLAVLPGGRIYAEGTPTQPITFTGPEPVSGSWAGLVLAGRSSCNANASGTGCAFEADPTITFGGSQLTDSSGSLRYVRILYAGQEIQPNEELNALTLLGVGSGTTLEYVQVDNGLDDGFEWFGGTVNGKYLVCSNMTDDCFDTSLGYTGKNQFLLAYQGTPSTFTGDPHGIEADNNPDAFDAAPRALPQFVNMTLVGSAGGAGGEGIRLRRGTGAVIANAVVTGYADRCINLNDAETFALASATAQSASLSMRNSWVGNCASGSFEDVASDPYAVSAWYNAGTGNGEGNPQLTGFLPNAGSPVLTGGAAPADAFFRPANYRGAFAGPRDNWTAGWTVNLPR